MPEASGNDAPPLRTVTHVDLTRYVGTWYEIASYPQRFQKGCTATTAVYTLREDGKIQVVNRCNRDSLDGRKTIARGRARVVDRESNAKLKVTFFWPFWGDYWIIDLDPEYRYAVVGHPSRKYLWILCRTRTMDPLVYSGILERLTAQATTSAGCRSRSIRRSRPAPDRAGARRAGPEWCRVARSRKRRVPFTSRAAAVATTALPRSRVVGGLR